MQLIGMLDSPYVRRVAVSMRLLDLAFDHRPLSVFRDFDAFAAINPAVKAPTLVTDDGVVLMESSLILDHVELLASEGASLQPVDIALHARAQQIVGLALAVCEKSVQHVYEHRLRPQDKRHEPWIERVTGQLLAACRELEAAAELRADGWLFGERPLQADVTLGVAWTFATTMLPDITGGGRFRELDGFAKKAEALPAFRACPFA